MTRSRYSLRRCPPIVPRSTPATCAMPLNCIAPPGDFIARFGAPDIVIANAGVSLGAVTDRSRGPRRPSDTVTRHQRHRNGPHLRAVRGVDAARPDAARSSASPASRVSADWPGSGAYSASKSAAITYLESLRLEQRQQRDRGRHRLSRLRRDADDRDQSVPDAVPDRLRTRQRGSSRARSSSASVSTCSHGRWRSWVACCACYRARSTTQSSRARRAGCGTSNDA